MKIVLFGIGKVYEEIKSQIDFHKVVGAIDNDYSKLYQEISGITVVQPERISEYVYDYIVICNTRFFDQMREQLILLGVDSKKIVGWQYYLYILKYGVNVLSRTEFESLCDILCNLGIQSILDVEGGIEKNAFYIENTRLQDCVKSIKVYSSEERFSLNVYSGNEKAMETVDAVLFLDFFLKHSVQEFVSKLEQIKNKTKYIVLSVPHPVCDEWREWAEIDLSQFGETSLVNGKVVKYLVVKILPKEGYTNNTMYIVSHKAFTVPKDSFYKPIYVGGYEPECAGALRDYHGENISQLNAKVNELTALYWIWKNIRTENVGFCHYRRYFGKYSNFSNPYFGIIAEKQVLNNLYDVDMLVGKAICTYPRSISGQLKNTVNDDAYDKCYKLYVDRIKQVSPAYLPDFESVMSGIVMYPCNMFFTNWHVFDAYCQWLFPIIIYVAQVMEVDEYDMYSRRVVGFFAERMLTVWIMHNNIRVREIEVINT